MSSISDLVEVICTSRPHITLDQEKTVEFAALDLINTLPFKDLDLLGLTNSVLSLL